MALNGISTATNGSSVDTKIYRRDLKLAEAQAKRQSLTTGTWYRPLNQIIENNRKAIIMSPRSRKGKPAHNKGLSSPNKGRPKEKVNCPHCSIMGGISAMNRWHFDKCKYIKEIL